MEDLRSGNRFGWGDCYIKRGEVVRCRECKWHNEREGCFFSTAEVDADDFCSYGERSSE